MGFFGDTSDLLKCLLETNTSVLMRAFHALIQPASWLFPERSIYFSSVTRLLGPNKSVHLSRMNFLGSPSVRVPAHLLKDGKLRSSLSAGVCDSLCGEPRCVHPGLGQEIMLYGKGVLYRKDGRIINA